MKKLLFLLSGISIVFYSCNNCQEKVEKNDLIPTDITIKYEQTLVVPEGAEVLKSLDRASFVNKLVSQTLEGSYDVYNPLDTTKKLSKAELSRIVGSWVDTIVAINEEKSDTVMQLKNSTFNKDELQRLLFTEKWYFNNKSLSMRKDIVAWCPVRVYKKEVEQGQIEEIKKMLFWYKPQQTKDEGNLTLLKENVTYEFALKNEKVPEWLENLNSHHFVDLLLDDVLNQRVKAYDFFDHKKLLTINEINENLGATTKNMYVENQSTGNYDTVQIVGKIFRDEITSLIFVEDWFIDWNTMYIKKKVKSIAPVRTFTNYRENGEEELEKKIPFIVELN